MTPRQKEALDLKHQGLSNSEIAKTLGINKRGVEKLLSRAKREKSVDPAVEEAMTAIKTEMVPSVVWVKTKNEDGVSHSVMLRPEPTEHQDVLETIRNAFEGMIPAAPVTPPENVSGDLLNLIPLFDAHFGMMAWGRETGGDDYDLKLAERDLRASVTRLLATAPAAKRGVLLIGGDMLHNDDQTNQTPQSRHQLDVDGRYFKILDTTIRVLAETIEMMLTKHSEVLVRVLRGNHDVHAHMALTFALEQRYREEPRITVEKTPRDLFMMQWGATAVFAHHGDKAKPQQLALYISDVCPFWSATKHRYALTGHIHHDSAKDLGPIRWESLRAFAPPDAYAASMGFGGRRALQSLTFHVENGLIVRVIDPLNRIG